MIKNKMIQRWKIKWYKDSSAWSAIRNESCRRKENYIMIKNKMIETWKNKII